MTRPKPEDIAALRRAIEANELDGNYPITNSQLRRLLEWCEAQPSPSTSSGQAAWQPIETAPLHKIILLWAATSTDPPNWKMATGCCAVNFDGEREWEWDGRILKSYDTKPTHWQPLPEPPQ